MKASLNVTDGRGEPVSIPDNVRLYFLSGFQHGGNNPGGPFPGPNGTCQNPTNPNYHGPVVRALLMALDAWADRGIKPPESNYPTVQSGTLVSLKEARDAFPKIPGVTFPGMMNELELLDFGTTFKSEGGKLSKLPAGIGPSYKLFVPKGNEDGLAMAGIRPMEVRVPLGTNTGWNVRAVGSRGPNLCSLTGSFLAFATTKAERLASGDPRKSIEERYENHAGYVNAVRQAAKKLVEERLLLEEDANRFISAAEASNVLKTGTSSKRIAN
jgi:hypothetical protein